jgi:dihydropyrimidinase
MSPPKPDIVSTVVRGGVVVGSRSMRRADVAIAGERIVGVLEPGAAIDARQVIDATGRYVLPGIIDVHHHPVYSDRIDTLSVSAALGGTTTVIGFVGAIKAWGGSGSMVDAVDAFIEEGERTSIIDFSAHGSLTRDDLDTLDATIPALIDRGVTSFKGFMAYAKRGMKLEDAELLQAMTVIAEAGGMFQVHAENGALLDHLSDRFAADGRTAPEYHGLASPPLAETESILRIATLAAAVRCPLYIVHLSARQSVDVVRLWRQWDQWPLHVETCIHYLTLTHDELTKRGSLAKVGPALRQQADIDALWDAIADGTIDTVATDFAGHTVERKQPIWEDVFRAPTGLPGIGNLLTIVNDAGVNAGRITLPKLVDVLCERPARIFGLYPRKGTLSPGADADLVLFDPGAHHVIRATDQRLVTDYSMWEGRVCTGFPTLVMQRGRVIVDRGEVIAQPGDGGFLARTSQAHIEQEATAR